MAFHIVTKRCFLACEKVSYVIIERVTDDRPKLKKSLKKLVNGKAKKPLKEVEYDITIGYVPLSASSNSNRADSLIDIRVAGKKEAYAIYAEIIKEIQEQHPTEAFLDKLVNNMLQDADFKVGDPKDPDDDLW